MKGILFSGGGGGKGGEGYRASLVGRRYRVLRYMPEMVGRPDDICCTFHYSHHAMRESRHIVEKKTASQTVASRCNRSIEHQRTSKYLVPGTVQR